MSLVPVTPSILSQLFVDDRIDSLFVDRSISLVDYVDQIMKRSSFWAFGNRAGLDDLLSFLELDQNL